MTQHPYTTAIIRAFETRIGDLVCSIDQDCVRLYGSHGIQYTLRPSSTPGLTQVQCTAEHNQSELFFSGDGDAVIYYIKPTPGSDAMFQSCESFQAAVDAFLICRKRGQDE